MLNRSQVSAFWVLTLTVVAFGLRFTYVSDVVIDNPVRADAAKYVLYAFNLLNEGVFSSDTSESPEPDSYRSPGYPLLLSSVMAIAGLARWYQAIIVLQVAMGAALVPLTFAASRRTLPAWGRWVASTLVAVSPHLVASTSYILTECTFAFVLLLSLWLLFLAVRRDRPTLYCASGAVFGFAYLVNETLLFLPIILILLYAAREYAGSHRSFTCILPHMGCFLAAFLIVCGGWFIRNATLEIPAEKKSVARARASIVLGSYPSFFYKSEKFRYYPQREDPQYKELCQSWSNTRRILWVRIKERPLRFATWYLVQKPYYFWSWNLLQGQGDVYVYPVRKSIYQQNGMPKWTHVLSKTLHPAVLIFALIAILASIKNARKLPTCDSEFEIVCLVLVLLYFTAIYGFVFQPLPRYSIPLRPELYITAMWGLNVSFDAIQARIARTKPS